MSSNLTAEPVDRKKLQLGTSLKFALRKYCGEPINITFTHEHLPFLSGVIAAGDEEAIRDAKKLIEFIDKHGEVRIKEEY